MSELRCIMLGSILVSNFLLYSSQQLVRARKKIPGDSRVWIVKLSQRSTLYVVYEGTRGTSAGNPAETSRHAYFCTSIFETQEVPSSHSLYHLVCTIHASRNIAESSLHMLVYVAQ
ncbi:hypothetical protein L207DRAFT_167976 [Hyaloscypha variabilis F]|uniref:Secreted protein n=1 Tax=Hyaloscypha variabilis (strain UAMH 11265 / GT02V1 / F) TaxID=1149755 RepID=A0A2J6R3X2_HYAVF|nr:hypothetical protein L207DRAFT_167976 [Hyaloscypha variabilis F]